MINLKMKDDRYRCQDHTHETRISQNFSNLLFEHKIHFFVSLFYFNII